MLRERIIRAWKDPEFRTSLSEDDLAELPENPAGAIELSVDVVQFVVEQFVQFLEQLLEQFV